MNTMDLTVKVNPEAVLSKVSRMFDNSPESIIRELAQNARRAGATRMTVDLCSNDKIILEHNGKPLDEDDFKAMFSLGDTGWKASTLAEDPAGCGFFISTLFDKIVIHSQDLTDEYSMWEVIATKDKLITVDSQLQVNKSLSNMEGNVKVRVTLYGKHNITRAAVQNVAYNFPIRIAYTYRDKKSNKICCVDNPSYLENFLTGNNDITGIECDMTLNNVRYIIISNCLGQGIMTYRHNHVFFNYHGHLAELPDELDDAFKTLCKAHSDVFSKYDSVLLVLPEENSDVRMVLPARHTIVQNDAYHQILKDVKKVMAAYINSRKTHNLPYEIYEWLGGSSVIHNEAVMPDNIRTRSDKDYILTVAPGYLVDYLIKEEGLSVVVFDKSFRYKGYSWYDKLPWITERDITVIVNGGPMEATASGIVDTLQVKLGNKIILEPTTVLYPDNVQDKYGFYGCQTPDMAFYSIKTDDYDKDRCISKFTEYIMEKWEPADDFDADHPETQRDQFSSELAELLNIAFNPEARVIESLGHFFDCHGWAIDSSIEEAILLGRKGEKSFTVKATGSFYGAEITEMDKGDINDARRFLNKIIKDKPKGSEDVVVEYTKLRKLRKMLG